MRCSMMAHQCREPKMLRHLVALISLLVPLAFGAPAFAADYPTKPVTLVVALTPGGPSDVLSRIVGKQLEKILGVPVVIDKRAGGARHLADGGVAPGSDAGR